MKAGYSKPKKTESSEYKPLNADGIQEGVELSDAAKSLLEELREKYGNMDISVAEWSTDEEQDYYAEQSNKDYSVLINPELLEKMATDPAAREKYEKELRSRKYNACYTGRFKPRRNGKTAILG